MNASGEPSVRQALIHEIPSAQRIGLLCAFIKRSGLRLLQPALTEFLQAQPSRSLRLNATDYLGPTDRGARLHTKAWLGQGLFRHRVAEREPACRVTGLKRQEFLVASHIKPWRDCDNSERLDGANGLLLSPHVDKLFDRHWISFASGGQLICEHAAAREALRCWGIEGANLIRPFSREQEMSLEAHRDALRS